MVPDVLTKITGLQELKEASVPCIYFLVEKEKIVYVGQTHNLNSRVKTHKQDKVFEHVYWVRIPEKCLKNEEEKWIRKLKPKYNKSNWASYKTKKTHTPNTQNTSTNLVTELTSQPCPLPLPLKKQPPKIKPQKSCPRYVPFPKWAVD